MLALPTDAELIDLAAATYAAKSNPLIEDIDRAIRVFLTTRRDGLRIFAIEGTHNKVGWALDFVGLTATDHQGFDHKSLGFLHAGFYASAIVVLTRIALTAGNAPFAICGHSLGAVLALMVGALLIDDDMPPVKIAAFAPPRGGGAQFVKIATSVPCSAYRFGNDPVTDIPIALPGFPYVQVPLIEIGSPMFNPFWCHHIENYVAGVHSGMGQ